MRPPADAAAWRRYLRFFRADVAADVEDELAFHLAMRERDLVAQGLSPEDARARALQVFGELGTIRDVCISIDRRRERRLHRGEVMNDVMQDLRFALRSFRRNPGFLAAVVATLALGIGASTAMFSLIDAALLRSLPFAAPDELVVVWGTKEPGHDIRGASVPEVADWRAMNRSLTDLSLWDQGSLNLRVGDEPVRVSGEMVNAGFWELVGARPARGRVFLPEEDAAPNAHPVVVISDELWRSRFGADPGVVGTVISINDRPLTVVGVMPPGFKGLSFTADFWYPASLLSLTVPGARAPQERGNRWLMAIGRLRPGVTMADAQRDFDAIAARLAASFPDYNTDRGARLFTLRGNYLGTTEALFVTLFGAVLLFLLIACVNVTSLQLVRSVARRREIAMRVALGADRLRLVRQLLVEGLALAALGGAAGALIAWWGVRAATPLVPAGLLPPYAQVGVDGRALAFGLAVSLLAGVLFGLAPALRAGRLDLVGALREGGRSSGSGLSRIGRPGAQQLLVVGQVALALVLLAGAGLMLRSLRNQLAVSPGFRPEGVIAARVTLPAQRYAPPARAAFVDQLRARLEALPQVGSVAIASDLPFDNNSNAAMVGIPDAAPERIRYYRHIVTPGFFATLGIPLVAGRDFAATDADSAPGVAIISQAMARRFWPDADPIGKRLALGAGPANEATVVGVVGSARYRDLSTNLGAPGSEPDIYYPLAQLPTRDLSIAIRTRGTAAPSLATIQREVAAIDPLLPVFRMRALGDDLRGQSASGRFASLTLGVFSAAALLLAAVGIYGVIAFVVGNSRKEIAIRLALGARTSSVLRLIVRGGLALTAAGVVLGIAGSTLMGRALSRQLFAVSPTDPATLGTVALAVLLVAAAATYVPARKATQVAPQSVLRE